MSKLKKLQKILKFVCYGIIGVFSVCIVLIVGAFSYLETRDLLNNKDYFDYMKRCTNDGFTYRECHFLSDRRVQ